MTPGGFLLTETLKGLTEGDLYRWRARVQYAPFHVNQPGITPPPNPRAGPWRRVQAIPIEASVRVLPEPGVLALGAATTLLAALARCPRQSRRRS